MTAHSVTAAQPEASPYHFWGIFVSFLGRANPPGEPSRSKCELLLLSTSRWIEDQKAYITELPEAIQQVILEYEKTGKYNAPEYQNAMMQYYNLHVCRLKEWPACLNRAFAKLNVSLYEYMWGPSEFTVTGTLKNYDRVNRLNQISIPVLFTCGNYDEATPATVKVYQESLPGSEIHVFEDASHEHHLEKTQDYLEVVRTFLNRN